MSERNTTLKLIVLTIFILNIPNLWACIEEHRILGSAINQNKLDMSDFFVELEDGTYRPLSKVNINPLQVYSLQHSPKRPYKLGDFDQYNQNYLEYYRYARMQKFLAQTKNSFENLGYEQVIVGKSLEGRDLYAVRPKVYDTNKKTILMFGRHHGDEGTANWIIEGFIEEFLLAGSSFHDEYQLVLYPMINPDGAEAQTRYNSNNRDLNRSWHAKVNKSFDESKIINRDLQTYLKHKEDIEIVLDMHGSFTDDFIFRVEEDFISRDFYHYQQQFIDELSTWDSFQAGNFILSNGHPMMARLVMIQTYGLHALTHETPRDIKIHNQRNRSLATLKEQGVAVFNSIVKLY